MTICITENPKLEQSKMVSNVITQSEDQLTYLAADEDSLHSILKEFLAVIVFAIASTLLMIHLDAFERLYKFSRSLEHYQFGEIAVFLPSFLSIGLVLFSYHRIQKLESEMIRRREVEKQLLNSEKIYRELSITDDLTRLYNSRYFYQKMEEEINRLLRYKQKLSLLLVDIDDFKRINDRYGHMKGDKTLQMAGSIIRNCLRQTDSAYRYGGEEFTVILPETGIEGAIKVAERIRKRFEEQDFSLISNETLNMSVSIGVSEFKSEEGMDVFVKRTDDALYLAKKKGKNRVCSS